MITFLPYPDFEKCAKVIDNKRLWKQILEANQLIKLIKNKKIKSGWRKSPCYKMWAKYPALLIWYRDHFVKEWLNRRLEKPLPIVDISLTEHFLTDLKDWPKWLKDIKEARKLCYSHRAALLAKNPEWYSLFKWKEKAKIEYYWPK